MFLNEGEQVRVKKIVFQGNRAFSTPELKARMRVQAQGPLNVNDLEKDISDMLAFYKSRGFMDMRFVSEDFISYQDQGESAVLSFRIEEGDPVVLSEIVITGHHLTHPRLIRNALVLKEGDLVTPDKIDRSIKSLREKGYFSSINVSTQKKAGVGGGNRLVVQVRERKPRSFRAALGLNTERTLTARGLLELSHKNIHGRGRQLFSHLKLQSNLAHFLQEDFKLPGHLEHQASLMYMEPFLWSGGLSAQTRLSRSSQIFSHTVKEQKSLTDIVNTVQMDLTLNQELSRSVRLQATLLNWESRGESKKGSLCHIVTEKPLCQGDVLNLNTVGVSLHIDKRNHLLFATDGFLSSTLIEYSGSLYGLQNSRDLKFLKMEMKHFDFQPLPQDWVWVNHLQGGVVASLTRREGGGGIPVSRGFILGGVQSLRGFDGLIQGERVPDKEELPIEGANELIDTRAWFYFLLRTELRFPLWADWMGSVFYNGGFVNVAGRKWEKPYRQALGFGLRYQTLFGPISLYMGFKVAPKEFESRFVAHLSLGTF